MKAQLILTIEYAPGTTPASQLLDLLEAIAQRAAGEGLFTGDTDAEVDHWIAHARVPPPDSRWADAPEWAQWLAMDQDADWYWYAHCPTPLDGEWISTLGPVLRAPRPRHPIHWTHTLEPRPKNPA